MKNIQISEELFKKIAYYFIYNECVDEEVYDLEYLKEEISKELNVKVEKIVNRNLYTQYKTGATIEEREKARIEYLDRKGYHKDFRW